MSTLSEPIETWLKTFAKAVRERDFTTGERLFDRDVVAFGTAGFRLNGLAQLVADQWKAIWPKTTGFDFDLATTHVVQDGTLAIVVAEWSSQGIDGEGRTFPRRGRSTLVLRDGAEGLKAVHSHYSMAPATLRA